MNTIRGTAMHVGGWRHPESTFDDILDASRYQHIARVLEAACFDACFFADLFGLYDVHGGSYDPYLRRGGQISFLDSMMVLPVMVERRGGRRRPATGWRQQAEASGLLPGCSVGLSWQPRHASAFISARP